MSEPTPRRLLFICRLNRSRSATAERLFAKRTDLDVRSAGTAPRRARSRQREHPGLGGRDLHHGSRAAALARHHVRGTSGARPRHVPRHPGRLHISATRARGTAGTPRPATPRHDLKTGPPITEIVRLGGSTLDYNPCLQWSLLAPFLPPPASATNAPTAGTVQITARAGTICRSASIGKGDGAHTSTPNRTVRLCAVTARCCRSARDRGLRRRTPERSAAGGTN